MFADGHNQTHWPRRTKPRRTAPRQSREAALVGCRCVLSEAVWTLVLSWWRRSAVPTADRSKIVINSNRNMHLHRLRFSRSSVCQSPLLRLVGGCRLGLRAARPAPTGSATASRQAGTHHDSAFQLQYSYYRLPWSLRPSCKTHPFRRNGPRC